MKYTFLVQKLNKSSLKVIGQSNTILEEYSKQGFVLTLRQLYYQFVSRDFIPNNLKAYKRLGEIVGNGRLCGMIDWNLIEDRTRNLTILERFNGPSHALLDLYRRYHVDLWRNQEWRPEVWIEKDALSGVIEGVCFENDIPFFSCRGYTSLSEMYRASLRIRNYADCGYKPYIIHFGDHDPSGMDMSRDIVDRVKKTFMADFQFKRVALNMDQIEEYEPPPNPAKLALALDTVLPTPKGWTTMEDVKVGEELFGSDGKSYLVTGKSEVFSNKICYELTFSGGDKIVCSADHLWNVKARKRRGGTVSTQRIAATWHEGRIARPVYRVQVAKSIETTHTELPIPPYVLGAWLGDGFSNAEGFACGIEDEETLDLIRQEGFEVRRKPSHPVAATIYKLRGKLYNLGVANNKHIPMIYLRASQTQRLHLLQGLMDTDGTVVEHKGSQPCTYGSSREGLAHEVLELVNSLGFKGRIFESRAVLNGEDYGPTWKVEFYPGNVDVFRLSRKRKRLHHSKLAERQNWRTIINVRPVKAVKTQCLSIDSPDRLYLAGVHFIPTHNTDSRYEAYVAKYGDESWELDALEPIQFRQLIEAEIKEIRNEEQWKTDLLQCEKEREKLKHIAENWDKLKLPKKSKKPPKKKEK